ncbi:hypothetical protein C8R45DRAFT_935209 [Mycena sanguinolenta]|nr:hypothetical protein C8R45DRAFT_935209 [Mycena sanguinolenta]
MDWHSGGLTAGTCGCRLSCLGNVANQRGAPGFHIGGISGLFTGFSMQLNAGKNFPRVRRSKRVEQEREFLIFELADFVLGGAYCCGDFHSTRPSAATTVQTLP